VSTKSAVKIRNGRRSASSVDGVVRTAGYIRCSLDPDGSKHSTKAQEKSIRAWTGLKGPDGELRVMLEPYVDDNVRGGRGVTRPRWEDLMEAARRGEIDAVCVTELSRLGRSLRETLTVVEELADLDVQLISLRESLDTGTAAGRLCLHVMLSLAQFEKERLGERLEETHRYRAAKGEWRGGPAPLGYRYEKPPKPDALGRIPKRGGSDRLLVVEKEAKVVRRCFELRAQKDGSLQSVCRCLNEEGFKGPYGGTLTASSVSRIINNPVYTGLNILRDGTEVDLDLGDLDNNRPSEIERPLVSRELWHTVQAKEARSRAMYGRGGEIAGQYLFSGYIYCGREGCVEDGVRMQRGILSASRQTAGHVADIRCPVCSRNAMSEQALERIVFEALTKRANSVAKEGNSRAVVGADAKRFADEARLEAELAAVEARRTRLLDALEGGLQPEDIGDRMDQLRHEGMRIRAALEALRSEVHLAGSAGVADLEVLLESWDALDTMEKREGVRRAARRITITPMGKKRPTAAESRRRVKIEWL